MNLDLSDDFVDIVGDGYDLAIRIAELSDSSLVARRLAPVHRILCASPDYIEKHGVPSSIEDLANNHVTIAATNQDPWRLAGPNGIEDRAHASPVENKFKRSRTRMPA